MSSPADDDSHVPMRVAAVVVDPDTKSPVLVLRAVYDSALYLPIFIGHLEATAIATFIAGMELPRPMTHDLMVNVLAETGWTLERVTVTRLEESTFYAELRLRGADGDVKVIDARPSDSIATALRAGAKIFVAQAVLDQAGGRQEEKVSEGDQVKPPEPEEEPVPLVDANTDLADIDPELFSKYKM